MQSLPFVFEAQILEKWTMVGGIIIFVFILNCIMWISSYSAFTALFWILTFDSALFCAYKLLGVQRTWLAIKNAFIFLCYSSAYISESIDKAPTISAGIICGLGLLSILFPFYMCIKRVRRRQWKDAMLNSIVIQLQRMEELQQQMEKEHNEILKQNKEIKCQLAELARH